MSNVVNRITPYLQDCREDTIVFIPEFIETAMFPVALMNVIPLTPLEYGELETSLEVTAEGTVARFHMSAFSEQGYDYADIQHRREDFNHPIRGQAMYLEEGVEKSVDEIASLFAEGIILIFEMNA